MPRISVIIPTLNESDLLLATIKNALQSSSQPEDIELIVVDAGGDSLSRLKEYAAGREEGTLQIVEGSIASRGVQLNAGLKVASAPIVLCLHADCLLPKAWDDEVYRILGERSQRPPILGCFRLGLADDEVSLSTHVMLASANLRARWLSLPYGDQAYFVRRADLDMVGGFANIPLMEDVGLLYRMKPRIVMSDKHVRVSSRRWKAKGVWQNTLLNQVYMLAWHLGVSPDTIYTWYYGRPPTRLPASQDGARVTR